MITVHTIASGSSGNAWLLSGGGVHLLLDAGVSCRRITLALRELGLEPADLDALCITHTHSDHIAGVQTLLKKTAFPIYSTERAQRELLWRFPQAEERLQQAELCTPFSLGDLSVTAFPTSHDSPGACGYRFDSEEGSVGLITDTGYVTDEAADILPGVDLCILEANHDVETLCSGPYPYSLKQRILGIQGHLSNEDSARFAVQLAESGASSIILAHLSRENNTPAMALSAVEQALSAAGLTPQLSVAPRDHLSEAYPIQRRAALCRK